MAESDLQSDILGPELHGEVESYAQAQQLLLASARHDLEGLRALLRDVPATIRDPTTGYTCLHAAVSASVPGPKGGDFAEAEHVKSAGDSEAAEQTLRLLFENGAIWNDLDENNETPACLARRLGHKALYDIIVDAGVRAELLLNRLDAFAPLEDSDDDDDEDAEAEGQVIDQAPQLMEVSAAPNETDDLTSGNAEAPSFELNGETFSAEDDASTQNVNYLSSALTFTDNRILDSADNGVMMAWESNLMKQTASSIVSESGLAVLNIGFGMGIFDTYVQESHKPGQHHIVEAHPDVLARMQQTGWDPSSPGYNKLNVNIHEGRWQDVLPQLVSENIIFDAIFFDTFAEDYNAFREFFSEYAIALLNPGGKWSFFHGLGADRQVCYDVYTKLVEMDLFEAGFEVEWDDVALPELAGQQAAASQWQGVRRSYFSVDGYRLPVCRFIE